MAVAPGVAILHRDGGALPIAEETDMTPNSLNARGFASLVYRQTDLDRHARGGAIWAAMQGRAASVAA